MPKQIETQQTLNNTLMAHVPTSGQWYLADLVVRFDIDSEPSLAHINTILLHAELPEQAYFKALAFGADYNQAYKNTNGHEVRMRFAGLHELTMISEQLRDGAEIRYEELHDVSESDIENLISEKSNLAVFQPKPS